MRLLKACSNGDFRLTQNFPDQETPHYAILSHRWESDGQEVSFGDMVKGEGRDKTGYKKIKFCGEQAMKDGLEYFWVDSCCIDKEIKVEHSQAIRSMFRWYRNATRCYVYLSDVSVSHKTVEGENIDITWELEFRRSKWFTRGWTLQELLASNSVEFFSKESKRLGDRDSLKHQIHDVTSVPLAALEGASLSDFTVNDRLSWMEHRQTTLEEDRAYSLLGIFGVSITPLYGEGMTSAFKRLQDEINKLETCMRTLYLTDPSKDKRRIEEAKGGLLFESYRWVLEHGDFQQWRYDNQSQLFWIKGDPGKGKTMLLCGIIDEMSKPKSGKHLLSYFFCQATDSRINSATAVLRGLLYVLINQQPSLASHIQQQYDKSGGSLFQDANAWITVSEIFTNILADPGLVTTYLIIDALDECTIDLQNLLDFIIRHSSLARVKWLVSSRNWRSIEDKLGEADDGVNMRLELNAESVSAAVEYYIEHRVSQLAKEKKYDSKTRDAVSHHLLSNAQGTFLWVALVYENLRSVNPWKVLTKLKDFPPGLDCLYQRMMDQIENSEDAEFCKHLLALATIVYRPITLEELSSLSDLPESITQNIQWLAAIVDLCGSFINLRDGAVYLVHQSAQDYLLRDTSKVFPSGEYDIHYQIFSRSLETMSKILHRDMYSLGAPGILSEDIRTPSPDPLATVRYSCVYWIDHYCTWLSNCDTSHTTDLIDGGKVNIFIQTKYLYWLEALGLCRQVPKGILGIRMLETHLMIDPDTYIMYTLLRDARRFIMYNKTAIETSPLQAYVSALIFSPTGSMIRRYFQREEPDWIQVVPPAAQDWSPCLLTLESHHDGIRKVAFSSDSTRVASYGDDSSVRIWDARSGECLETMFCEEGHSGRVEFFSDLKRFVLAPHIGAIQIWDIAGNQCEKKLTGTNGLRNYFALSPDFTRLASASTGGTIQIWDTTSFECISSFKCGSEEIYSLAFFPDMTRIVSSANNMVQVLNASDGHQLMELEGHYGYVASVAVSPDSSRIASGSSDATARIWSTSTGQCIWELEGHVDNVNSLAFSPNSLWLVSGSHDRTARIWCVVTGECLVTLSGHGSQLTSIAFSPDSTLLASGSWDQTVRIWDMSSHQPPTDSVGHDDMISTVAFSYDLKRFASASYDRTIRIWDTSNGQCETILDGHDSGILWVTFSPDSKFLASASEDHTIRIWDLGNPEGATKLIGHEGSVEVVAFSHDSTLLVSGSWDRTVRIWRVNNGECLATLKGHHGIVYGVAFAPDHSRIATASNDNCVMVWDANSYECLSRLRGHLQTITTVAFSSDSKRLISTSRAGEIRIWHVSTGRCLAKYYSDMWTRGACTFDDTGRYLQTSIGALLVDVPPSLHHNPDEEERRAVHVQGIGMSSQLDWITWDARRAVWLPTEYRSRSSQISGSMLGIGAESRKVWICHIQGSKIPNS